MCQARRAPNYALHHILNGGLPYPGTIIWDGHLSLQSCSASQVGCLSSCANGEEACLKRRRIRKKGTWCLIETRGGGERKEQAKGTLNKQKKKERVPCHTF